MEEHAAAVTGDSRLQLARGWLREVLDVEGWRLVPLAGDASFRRYFRVIDGARSLVLMDAPPERESVAPFLRVRAWLEEGGVRVPHLVAGAASAGWLLLEDFGDVTWAQALAQGARADGLFEAALAQWGRLLSLNGGVAALPRFDRARMVRECMLFPDWYLPMVRGGALSDAERDAFRKVLGPLLDCVVHQPQVPIHLDFHSRNLMALADGRLGVIDFQDACVGPVTYDMASLIYDCYQDYGAATAEAWSRAALDILPKSIRGAFSSWEAWHRSLQAASLQRHIKVCGIFARLVTRDGKRQFLDWLPQTRRHLHHEMTVLDETITAPLRPWLLLDRA